jgi:sugar phosphate permease
LEREEERENENIDIENIKFLHNLSKEKFNLLMDSVDKLDQKFVTLFSVDVVVLSIIFSLNRSQQKPLFFAGITLITVAIIIAVLGYRPKTFTDIDIETCWEDYFNSKHEETIVKITSNIVLSYTKNRIVQDKKANYIRLAFIFSLSGIIIIILSQMVIYQGG